MMMMMMMMISVMDNRRRRSSSSSSSYSLYGFRRHDSVGSSSFMRRDKRAGGIRRMREVEISRGTLEA